MSGKNRILRIIMQFITGCIGACGVFLIWAVLIILVDSKYAPPEDWIFVLFIIMSVGSVSGIFLIDKLVFKVQGYNILEMTIGFLTGFVGIAFLQWFVPAYWGVDILAVCPFVEDLIDDILYAEGVRYLVVFPLTSTLFSIIGYNVTFWLRHHLPHRSRVLDKEQ
jgi:hypothetical protein